MKLPVDLALSRSELPSVENFADNLQSVWDTTRRVMAEVQRGDKDRADRTRRESAVKIGDQVMLSTKNITLKDKTQGKLKPRWIGPYEVIK